VAVVLLILLVVYAHRVIFVEGAFRQSLNMVLLSAGFYLGANAFWIVRFVIAGVGVTKNIAIGELRYFAASPPIEVLSLRGFWLDAPFVDISELVPMWWLLFVPLLFLAVYGAFRMAEKENLRWLVGAIITVAFLGVALAVGPGWPTTEPLFRFLWEEVPLYSAFRDSHKFVALSALAYAYLGAFSVQEFRVAKSWRGYLPNKLVRAASVTPVVAVLIYGLPMFGAWGQLSPSEFPSDWKQVRTILDKDGDDFNVLVLPWHMYMDFPWLDNRWKRLANPAPNFFSQPTIYGDNIEAGLTESNSSNPVSRYVESLLTNRDSLQNFGRLIAPLNAKYVIIFKVGDYRSYDFLQNQSDIELMLEDENIALYRNLSPTARSYAVNKVAYVDGLEGYLSTSSDQDPIEYLYVLGSESVEPGLEGLLENSTLAIPTVVKVNPASYRVEQAFGEYFVFTLAQRTVREGWEYRGRSGVLNLGMMPAFESESGNGKIAFSRFYWLHAPLYALALASLIASAVSYWWRPHNWPPARWPGIFRTNQR